MHGACAEHWTCTDIFMGETEALVAWTRPHLHVQEYLDAGLDATTSSLVLPATIYCKHDRDETISSGASRVRLSEKPAALSLVSWILSVLTGRASMSEHPCNLGCARVCSSRVSLTERASPTTPEGPRGGPGANRGAPPDKSLQLEQESSIQNVSTRQSARGPRRQVLQGRRAGRRGTARSP